MRVAQVRQAVWANDFITACNTGIIRVYDGTRPTNGEDSPTGTMLAELTFNATSFDLATRTLTARAITEDSVANNTGTPTHAVLYQSNGTTIIGNVSAAVGSGELNFASLITAGNKVQCSSFVVTMPVGS
jgi:hypothetical protein